MRGLVVAILALAACASSASAQNLRLANPQLRPSLQQAADQRWSAVFEADRAYMNAVREAIRAEIALRQARGENVSRLQAELDRLTADQQMSFSMQYMQLQAQMHHENQSYTAISNIMRTKHETVRNSISNVR